MAGWAHTNLIYPVVVVVVVVGVEAHTTIFVTLPFASTLPTYLINVSSAVEKLTKSPTFGTPVHCPTKIEVLKNWVTVIGSLDAPQTERGGGVPDNGVITLHASGLLSGEEPYNLYSLGANVVVVVVVGAIVVVVVVVGAIVVVVGAIVVVVGAIVVVVVGAIVVVVVGAIVVVVVGAIVVVVVVGAIVVVVVVATAVVTV